MNFLAQNIGLATIYWEEVNWKWYYIRKFFLLASSANKPTSIIPSNCDSNYLE